jgi:hypothetical protein
MAMLLSLGASLSAVGKRALLGHDGCKRVLRHHALNAVDVQVGGPSRGALTAAEGRREASAGVSESRHSCESTASPPPVVL